MKTALSTTLSAREPVKAITSPIKVCMHVLGKARGDVRAMRAASALVEAGFAVSIVDIEDQCAQSSEEDACGAFLRHIVVPQAFLATRFQRWALFRAAWMLLRGVIRLLQTPADIYHALDLPALPACYLAALIRRKPLIFDAYELPLSTPLSALSTGRRWLHKLLRLSLAWILPRCASVITVSPPIVQALRDRYSLANVALVRNILPYHLVARSDRLRQRLGLGARTSIGLYQGNLQPDRSLAILVRAAAFLKQDIVLVLMGKAVGTTQAQLEALIKSEGVADRVKILPAVPYAELLDWTASADIGLTVLSPDYSPNIQMMLPNKLFEYIMAGLPVLTTQLDAVIDIVRTYEIGQVVPSLAPAAIGEAINALLADTAGLARMRRNALEVAQHALCWEVEKSSLLQLYHELLTHESQV